MSNLFCMTLETITFEISQHVATITLDRPDQMNSFNETMCDEIAEAWATVRDTDDIHVAVLRANGERAFCTGIDVKNGAWWFDRNIWTQDDPGVYLGPRSHKVWKPVVCAVQGMCAGGGQYLVNESDIVICSEDATFFDPHANASIVSALEPIGMLHRGVPLGDVLRWALMGTEERLTAETALRLGLVSEVVAERRAAPTRGRHRRADRGTQPTRRSRARSARSGSRSRCHRTWPSRTDWRTPTSATGRPPNDAASRGSTAHPPTADRAQRSPSAHGAFGTLRASTR